MASLTATQAASLVDQALQAGDRWQRSLPGFLTSQSQANLAQLQNALGPLSNILNGMQQFALVQAVAIVKGWGALTSDVTKLSQIGAAVGSFMKNEATLNALPNGGNTGGEGGRLVAFLATLT
jgi:hypothetical protein